MIAIRWVSGRWVGELVDGGSLVGGFNKSRFFIELKKS